VKYGAIYTTYGLVFGPMNAFTSQLTDPRVRQLFWCLFSPQLAQANNTASFSLTLNPDLEHWFLAMEQDPQPLYQYLEQSNHRLLGSYFECLWQFFFEFNPDWQLLAHNVQVIENKQTLGELDILANHKQTGATHLELAVKFYLQHPHHDGALSKHWLGPQCRDRLDIKLGKLNDKQFPFLRHSAAMNALMERQLPMPKQQGLVLKGYLFHQWKNPFTLPLEANKQCLMGQWLHESNIGQLVKGHENWLIIEKPQWLGAVISSTDGQNTLLSASQAASTVQKHFLQSLHKHALMLVKVQKKGEHLIEFQRFLIVNNDWPSN